VLGKIGNFDVTYAFSHLSRDVDTESDYADYSYWYDVLYGYGAYICDNFDPSASDARRWFADRSDPVHQWQGPVHQAQPRTAHRLAERPAPALRRRPVLAAQNHDIQQQYKINGLSPSSPSPAGRTRSG
jgi:hypothetical protein